MSKVKSYYGGSTSHYYTYNGSTLVQEKIVTSGSQTTEYLTFLYNSEGPTGFVYNNTLYTYRKNIFGDIIAVYNGTSKVAEYAYDAYGNCRVITGSNIGTLNPFRYRGYYFDEDMKLYYLQSRYYDPETGRFINADDVSYLDPETIHGLNLYTYCVNNPAKYKPNIVFSSRSTNTFLIWDSKDILTQISGSLTQSTLKKFYLFGSETRKSTGWETSASIATSFWGRIGISSYVTHTLGQPGILYYFSGETTDIMNWLGSTYYAGVGINLFDYIGYEMQVEALGVGSKLSIGNFSIESNINIFGTTSVTIGRDTDLGNGITLTHGFTIGINTGLLVAVIIWVCKALTTGDFSPTPGLQPG